MISKNWQIFSLQHLSKVFLDHQNKFFSHQNSWKQWQFLPYTGLLLKGNKILIFARSRFFFHSYFLLKVNSAVLSVGQNNYWNKIPFPHDLKISTREKIPPFTDLKIGDTTDYGHTMAQSLILCGPNSNPNPKWIFGMWI